MNVLVIVLFVVVLSACQSAGTELKNENGNEENFNSRETSAKKFSEKDYHKIKKSVELTPAVQDRIQTNSCFAPAIAAWVDYMKKEATRTRQRLPGRFGIVEIQNVYSSQHMILSGLVLKKKQHLGTSAETRSYRVQYSNQSTPKCAVVAVAPVI